MVLVTAELLRLTQRLLSWDSQILFYIMAKHQEEHSVDS